MEQRYHHSDPAFPAHAVKLGNATAKSETALDELNKMPPDNQAAVGNIEGAVGDLEAAILDGLALAVGEALMDAFVAVARQLAVTAIDDAVDRGGNVGDAQDALAAGDDLRASGAFKDAVNKYKDALAKAESV